MGETTHLKRIEMLCNKEYSSKSNRTRCLRKRRQKLLRNIDFIKSSALHLMVKILN